MWELIGKIAVAYMIGAVFTFVSIHRRRDNDRAVNVFNDFQRKYEVDAANMLLSLFRISASAVWPLFWVVELIHICK